MLSFQDVKDRVKDLVYEKEVVRLVLEVQAETFKEMADTYGLEGLRERAVAAQTEVTWFDNQPTVPEERTTVRMAARAAGFSQSQADYLNDLERRLRQILFG